VRCSRSPRRREFVEQAQHARRLAHDRVVSVPRITGQHRRHHALRIGHGVRAIEDDALQTPRIPRFDTGAKGLDADIERLDKFRRPVDGVTAQVSIDQRRGETGRLERNGDAG